MSKLPRVRSITRWTIAVAWVVAAEGAASGQAQSTEPAPPDHRWFIGSSLFMLANVALEDPPSFYQMNIGRQLSQRNAIALELITWRYDHPLGIPYGSSYAAEEEAYPGFVRGSGAGLAYQRYWWRGLYTGIHAT